MTTTTIAAWLLTYLIHSTIILVAALSLSRLMGGRNLAVQEGMLRTALVGGILTATVQLGFGIAPVTGALALPAFVEPVAAVQVLTQAAPAAETPPIGSAYSSGTAWATALIALWVVTSISALLFVLRSILDLRRLLQTRCFQPAGLMVEKLAAVMGLRRRVKVSTSGAIAVPFATGITQPEICCPERVNQLAREHQRGLFAHELAHLVRHDPAWQLLYRLGEAVFSLQPLNRLVRRRLEEIAEHLTDERAVAGTGDRLGLARCLVVVAHWNSATPIGLPATTFAAGPRLDRRVRRLLSGKTARHVNGGWVIAVASALLIGSVSILPAIGAIPAQAEVNSTPDGGSASWTLSAEETKAVSEGTNGKTWSIAAERPADAPPPADPPAPPMPVSPALEVAPLSGSLPAPASPPSAPTTGILAPPPRPSTPAAPMPSAEPAAAAAPKPPQPPVTPQPSETERRSEEQEARERARQQVERQVQLREEQRSRAEAMVREQRVIVREQAANARKMAEESARRSRVSDADRAEIRIQIRERQAVAQREARETTLAERNQARTLAEAARAAAREAIINGARLTDEQREELLRQAAELREQAELRNREATEAAEARAQALADEARRLAEQAEAERLEREKR